MKKGVLYSAGSIIILIICLFSFVLPSALGNNTNPNKLPDFGKYDGKAIRYEQNSDFANFVTYYADMYKNYGMQIDASSHYYIFSSAFNSAVIKEAYRSEVEKSGYKVPVKAVNRQLIPYFLDENGKYSEKLYKQADPAVVADTRASLESSLLANRFFDDVFGATGDIFGTTALYGLKYSDAELDFIKDYDLPKRGFDMVAFAKADYPEAEKINYAKNNIAKFTKYDMSVITCADKSTAEKVVNRIANNEITFVDAVSEYSDKNYSNTEGKLNNSYQYQLEMILSNKEDVAKLADLEVGKNSEVIQTTAGYSIFQANAKPVAADLESEEIKTVVSNYIKSYEATLVEDYFTAKATDFTSAAMNTSFEDACATMGVEKMVINPFPLNYASSSIASGIDYTLPGLSAAAENENFLKMAFSLKMNEISSPMVLDDFVVVIKYTNEVTTKDNEESSPTIFTELDTYDESACQNAILKSPKLENNFVDVYFDNFMSE